MYCAVIGGQVAATEQPEPGMQPLASLASGLSRVQVADLHHSFRAWGDACLSPGEMVAARTWVDADGRLAFAFANGKPPAALTHFGLARELAGWLVLLDKWVDTEIVIAEAQRVWSLEELGGALPFTTPVFLPVELVAQRPDNWERVAQALAAAVAPPSAARRT